MSKPQLYKGITFLLADSYRQFPVEFNPQSPRGKSVSKELSRESFIRTVDHFKGAAVVDLEGYDPKETLLIKPPEDIELRDGATYIIVPFRQTLYEEFLFEGTNHRPKNHCEDHEQKLLALEQKGIKYLERKGHTNIRVWRPFSTALPFFHRRVVSTKYYPSRELDAAVISDECALVIEYRDVMDKRGGKQLQDLVDFIEENKDNYKGSISFFNGRCIVGVLAGPEETKDVDNQMEMDYMLQSFQYLKWLGDEEYFTDPCYPFEPACEEFEDLEAYQKQTTGSETERKLIEPAVKYLEQYGHTNIRPLSFRVLSGNEGSRCDIDAAVIADNCALVILHRKVMDSASADQLAYLVKFIEDHNKWAYEGSVTVFKGKQIIGVLAGTTESTNVDDNMLMAATLKKHGLLKWLESAENGTDACSPFQVSEASCDAPSPTDSPGQNTTIPHASMPRRVGRLPTPMRRGSAMLVRPRLMNKYPGFRSSFKPLYICR